MRKILFILLLIPFQLFAQHWWVDNIGTGDTLATIAEVNALTLGSDDTVSFKKGCLWRDDVVLDQSGTAGHYIVFTTYGTGAKPKIYGSDVSASWTAEGTANIWQSTASFTDPYAGDDMEVWFVASDTIWGDHKTYSAGFTNLVNEYDWCYNASRIYVYAASDPDARYTLIEIPQRYYMFDINDQQYVEVNGFELAYGLASAAGETYPMGGGDLTGFTFRNNIVHHLGTVDGGGYGVFIVYNQTLIEDNEIYECGRRGVSLYNYGTDTIENIIVQDNYFHNNYHTMGTDISAGGDDPTGSFDSIIVRNNLINGGDSINLANPPATTYFRTEGTAHINKLYLYNNILMYVMEGFQLQGDAGTTGFQNIYIYNNTFYGVNKLMTGGRMFIHFTGVFSGNLKIKNNIFYQDGDADVLNLSSIVLETVTYDDVDVDYNLYYATDETPADVKIVRQNPPLVDWHHNDLVAMRAAWGWDVNSPAVSDPLFINITYPVEVDSLMIDALSPAKDAGIGLGALTTYDYYDSLRDASPDLGAIEYNPEDYDPPPVMPAVTTTTPVARYTRLVAVGGSGLDAGGGTITAKGVCYSTSANPTTSDSKVSGGTGTGSFGVLCPVTAGTTWHFRSYATNAEGTAYGSDLTVTTPIHSVAKTGGKILKTGGKIVQIH